MSESIEIRLLRAGDEEVLGRVDEDVFDYAVDFDGACEFLNDARHHIAVAIDDGMVVGFASGRKLGCTEAWVLTERDNVAAMRLYASIDGARPPSDHVMINFRLDDSDS